ncbi:zinc ABC transporter substrate-binding protein [Pseudomonas fulva]|jgi:ABC-type Zn uptake system ZnuABC Zn-binding protein ZnuA|uniref:Zinc ABC transporter substrate-binding protein n=1 Tax=Pseudomonas fulva TaxID=47880 RepID=A0A7S9LB12_9PSED|nr:MULTISPECIES: zinc ABC transporter substrate-binding protein [Pseudomonas]MCY4124245.1 zinc ABC transporter substrate-binding protein [Pseudomonas sp.]MBN6789728.1 zinc ABC transporter substrate-binding protein [Pseudomonas fulva]MBN6794699.1 zinc ABC transporter substrate-binding protein [Pseudomonas fulva]MBN6855483.1 zinc ABC transporter substrate-binding protein [Pseudomonas fulva]MBN6872320.1 zinc ABC transporter substrate-binding protein [Pseudomonas fulva]
MNLKRLCLAVALTSLPSLASATQVLTTLPVTHSLANTLLEGTSVELKRAAPANLPASRQPSYFSGRGEASLHKAAQQADAVIGVRSIWRDDPLYPVARRSNIRIVEIDAARPVDGALPGIAVTGADAYAGYPWLSPTNLGRMADVVANDLERLSPADKARIKTNLAGFKQQVLALAADSQTRLAKVENLTTVSLSERLGYLASGLNLDLVDQPLPTEWDAAALKALADNLKNQDVALVLDHRQPEAAVAQVIKDSGAKLVVVQSDTDDTLAGLKSSVDLIVEALGQG